jgi:5'-methylthioadenosine nucleosidase
MFPRMHTDPVPAPAETTVERIALLFALEAEAAPVVERLMLAEQPAVDPQLRQRHFAGTVGTLHVDVLTNGTDPRNGADRVGTDAATMATYMAIRKLAPDLLLNVGTCGGFAARGARVGDIYVSAAPLLFHDRRIPLDPFRPQAEGRWPCTPAPRLMAAIGGKPGIVSTGNSLDWTPAEMDFMTRERVTAKDMEATAIAQVCAQCEVPFIAVKGVTDLVDDPEPVQEAFLRNLRTVSALLGERTEAGVRWLAAHARRVAEL